MEIGDFDCNFDAGIAIRKPFVAGLIRSKHNPEYTDVVMISGHIFLLEMPLTKATEFLTSSEKQKESLDKKTAQDECKASSGGRNTAAENCQGTGVSARLDFFPEDVRAAVIQSYVMCLNGEKAPSDENGAKLQKERFEMLASNIKAGFEKLISC